MPLPKSIASRLDGDAFLRILRQVERFEDGWKRGDPEPLENLVSEVRGAESAELFRQALGVELDYRRRRGDRPTPEEYLVRFPDSASAVRDAFEEPTAPSDSGSIRDITGINESEPLPARIGKFVVLGRLGGGGQASAYLARDPDLGRLVVLKRYHAAADGPEAGGAAQDGQALSRLRSRYTPQCFGLERVGSELILVMEYVPGRNLAEVVKAGRLAPRAAAGLIEQVAKGLEAVHACGLIHRDVKPSNIVLGDDRVPRLVDFGLAAHLGSVALQGLSGSPPYMAPEQARGQWERIDGRTDVYGLGAVLYALLTGQPPHPGATSREALEHARRGEVKAPREWNRAIPRPLEAIVQKTLAADPAQRYATAAELRLALRGYRLRPCRQVAFALAGALALAVSARGLLSGVVRPESTNPGALPPVPTPAAALSGELTVRVWTPGGNGKQGWSVEDPRTLPVLAGEQVHLEAHLNQPAYAYLLWLDSQGRISSLYPWRDHDFGARPPVETLHETAHSPAALDEGWPMNGPGGLETALLLVRRTPLPANADLAALIGQLPPTPLRDPREVAVRGFDPGQAITAIDRGFDRGIGPEPEQIDDPLLRLMERLKPHFELIRATRFAYQGDSETAH